MDSGTVRHTPVAYTPGNEEARLDGQSRAPRFARSKVSR
jgi:hypothetical protein